MVDSPNTAADVPPSSVRPEKPRLLPNGRPPSAPPPPKAVVKGPPPPINPRTPVIVDAVVARPAGPPPKPNALPVIVVPDLLELDWDDEEDEKTTTYDKEATHAALAALESGAKPSVIIQALEAPSRAEVEQLVPVADAKRTPVDQSLEEARRLARSIPLPRLSPPPRDIPPVVPPMAPPPVIPPVEAPVAIAQATPEPLPPFAPLPPPTLPPISRQAITEPPASGSFQADVTLPRPAPLPSDISDIVPTEMVAASTATRRPPYLAIAGAVLAVAASALFLVRPQTGTVVVAAKAAGRGITAGQVFVDGRLVCTELPCRASGIEQGTHTVRVDAAGFAPGTDLVAVRSGQDAAFAVELVRAEPIVADARPAAPVAAPIAAPVAPPAETTVPIALVDNDKHASAPTSAPTPAVAKTEVKAAPVAKGTLSLDSSPPSKIVLDGRPIGDTPKAGLSVKAGNHTILFANPGGARKSVTVTVKAGESRSISVKLRLVIEGSAHSEVVRSECRGRRLLVAQRQVQERLEAGVREAQPGARRRSPEHVIETLARRVGLERVGERVGVGPRIEGRVIGLRAKIGEAVHRRDEPAILVLLA